MKTPRLFLVSALLLAGLATPKADAATSVEIPVRFTGDVTSVYYFDRPLGTQYDRLALSKLPFTADLNSLSGLTLNLCASDGRRIDVDLPEGKTGRFSINISYAGTLGSFDMGASASLSAEFVGLSGAAPVSESSYFEYRQNGNQVTVHQTYTFTAPFSFTAWIGEVAGGFSTSSGTMTYSDFSSDVWFSYPASSAGSQFVTFQAPVPEPASGTLLVFSVGIFALSRRQRK